MVLTIDVAAKDNPCFPKNQGLQGKLVYDEADMLSDGEERQLNSTLSSFAAQTSNQIIVVTVDDLCGDAPSVFATDLGHAWGVGQGKEDNGIVVLIKPKTQSSKGEVFIAVGYGLEGAIPDITAHQIVNYEMIPEFRNKRIFAGIQKGTNVLMELARGEYNSDAYAKKHKSSGKFPRAILVWVFIMIIFFGFRSMNAYRYSRLNNIGFWTAFWLLSNSRSSHGGSWGGFTGGGGFGGGGGGGFGGFGGGGFGGGGAGGSW